MAPDPVQLASDLPTAISTALPMWLLFFMVGLERGYKLVQAARLNGKAPKAAACSISTDPAFTSHCQVMEQYLANDPPRKHTELLTQILNEQRLLRSDMKRYHRDSSGN